jgi:hypothetical protein
LKITNINVLILIDVYINTQCHLGSTVTYKAANNVIKQIIWFFNAWSRPLRNLILHSCLSFFVGAYSTLLQYEQTHLRWLILKLIKQLCLFLSFCCCFIAVGFVVVVFVLVFVTLSSHLTGLKVNTHWQKWWLLNKMTVDLLTSLT